MVPGRHWLTTGQRLFNDDDQQDMAEVVHASKRTRYRLTGIDSTQICPIPLFNWAASIPEGAANPNRRFPDLNSCRFAYIGCYNDPGTWGPKVIRQSSIDKSTVATTAAEICASHCQQEFPGHLFFGLSHGIDASLTQCLCYADVPDSPVPQCTEYCSDGSTYPCGPLESQQAVTAVYHLHRFSAVECTEAQAQAYFDYTESKKKNSASAMQWTLALALTVIVAMLG